MRATINGLTFDFFGTVAQPARNPIDSKPITFWAVGLGGEVAEYAEVMLDLVNLAVASGNLCNLSKKFERDQPALKEQQDAIDDKMLREAGNVLFYLDKTLKKRGMTLNMAATSEIHVLDAMRAEQRAEKQK